MVKSYNNFIKTLEHDLSTGSVGPPLRCCEIMLREWSEGKFANYNTLLKTKNLSWLFTKK